MRSPVLWDHIMQMELHLVHMHPARHITSGNSVHPTHFLANQWASSLGEGKYTEGGQLFVELGGFKKCWSCTHYDEQICMCPCEDRDVHRHSYRIRLVQSHPEVTLPTEKQEDKDPNVHQAHSCCKERKKQQKNVTVRPVEFCEGQWGKPLWD